MNKRRGSAHGLHDLVCAVSGRLPRPPCTRKEAQDAALSKRHRRHYFPTYKSTQADGLKEAKWMKKKQFVGKQNPRKT